MLKPDVLRKKKDFSLLYNKGKSAGGKYVVLFCRKNGLPYNRRAALASKKAGNSVERNRARRLIKESYRLIEQTLPKGHDILIVARRAIADESVKRGAVEASILQTMAKVGLVGDKKKNPRDEEKTLRKRRGATAGKSEGRNGPSGKRC
jgi:ribonuclease P protein component